MRNIAFVLPPFLVFCRTERAPESAPHSGTDTWLVGTENFKMADIAWRYCLARLS
jgi:hypothetical protein